MKSIYQRTVKSIVISALLCNFVYSQPASQPIGSPVSIAPKKLPQSKAGIQTSKPNPAPPNRQVRTHVSQAQLILNVQKKYDQTLTFQAFFKQNYFNNLFRRTETKEGAIYYSKPNQIRFDYAPQGSKLFIVKDSFLWIYEQKDNLLQYNNCFQQDQLTAVMAFLGGKGKLTELFNIELIQEPASVSAAAPASASNTVSTLKLSPKTPTGLYKFLHLKIDNKYFEVVESKLFDHQDNQNQFIFSQRKYNASIDAKLFAKPTAEKMQTMNINPNCPPPASASKPAPQAKPQN